LQAIFNNTAKILHKNDWTYHLALHCLILASSLRVVCITERLKYFEETIAETENQKISG